MRHRVLGLLLLAAACSVTGEPSTGEIAATAPEWRALGLVIRNTDVTWIDSGGVERRVVSRLSEGEAGEHAIWVQIWAGDDPNRSAAADAGGTIVCP